jgi:hypothetical protein
VNLSFLLDSLGQRQNNDSNPPQQPSPPSRRSGYPALAPSILEQPQAPWSALSKHVPPTCPLDRLLLNFLHSRQRDSTTPGSTDPPPPSYPSVSSLLNPQGGKALDPLSQLMTDIISKFPNISALHERCGVLYNMFNVMRWQAYPTKENFELMPEYFRPTPSQIYTAHPVWIDHLPWPRMRDYLVANFHDYPFDNWFLPFTAGLSCNWPYDPVDCLLSTADQEEPVINPVFERHIRVLDNWSCGQAFADTFPALVAASKVIIREPAPSLAKRTKSLPGQV